MAENDDLPETIIGENELFHFWQYSGALLEEIGEYRNSNKFCDVVLVAGVDGRRVNAHRFVLASSIAYFNTMFTSGTKEAEEKEVTLEGVRGDVLESIIEFCYSGSIELRADNAEFLFAAAHHFQINAILDACAEYFARKLQLSNCLKYARLAEEYNCSKLLEHAHSYICEHYMDVYKTEEFLTLSEERLSKLIVRDDINVPSEEIVFNSLLLWIKHDNENRSKCIPKLLTFVRLPLLNSSFVTDVVKPICTTLECQELLLEASNCQSEMEKCKTKHYLNVTPRKSRKDTFILIINIDQDPMPPAKLYSTSENKWISDIHLSPIIFVVDDCVTFENKLFLFGIDEDGDFVIVSFDFNEMEWQEHQCEYQLFPCATMVVYENNIYIMGGLMRSDALSAVVEWNPNSNHWNQCASMHTGRHFFGVAVLGEHLYVIGGQTGVHDGLYLNSVERFDKNGWTDVCSMRAKRFQLSAAVFNNHIYVFGGINENGVVNDIERYDADEDIWTTVFIMEDARVGLGCVLMESKFYLIGGTCGRWREQSTFDVYDPMKNTMTRIQNESATFTQVSTLIIPKEIP